MGEYSSGTIKNGASPVPFDISLQNCIRVRNIETKLVTGKVGTQNTQLLGNTLTGSTAAKGVGVLIEGLATSKNPLMTLKPNDTNSVYIDYETEDDTSDGVYLIKVTAHHSLFISSNIKARREYCYRTRRI